MEFDKSRVYSSVNADELRAGDWVIVADDMLTLKAKVSEGFNWYVVAITSILGEEWYGRFDIDKHNFLLAYLVERAKNCTNCGEGKWDAEHKKIFCDPAHCGNGNVVFRNYEIEVCEYWKPRHDCQSCKYINCGFKDFNTKNVCDRWEAEPKTEPHYRPFKDTDELIKVWEEKIGATSYWGKGVDLVMPHIWVRSKGADIKSLIIGFKQIEDCNAEVFMANGQTIDTTDLYAHWTFLDGSVCGVRE